MEPSIKIVVTPTLHPGLVVIDDGWGSGLRIVLAPDVEQGPLAAVLTQVFVPAVRASIVDAIDYAGYMKPGDCGRGSK